MNYNYTIEELKYYRQYLYYYLLQYYEYYQSYLEKEHQKQLIK